jgi:hypothetical protein
MAVFGVSLFGLGLALRQRLSSGRNRA